MTPRPPCADWPSFEQPVTHPRPLQHAPRSLAGRRLSSFLLVASALAGSPGGGFAPAAAAELSPAVPGGAVPAPAKPSPAPPSRVSFRVATGIGYVRETWNPGCCSQPPGGGTAIYRGWAPTLELSVGRAISPRLAVGGAWQVAAAIDPRQDYLGTTYRLNDLVKLVDTVSLFGDYVVLPRWHLHGGASAGLLALTTWDVHTGGMATAWGGALSGFLGYDHPISEAWAVGVIARLTVYRSSFNTTPSTAHGSGLFPSLLLSFAYGRTRTTTAAVRPHSLGGVDAGSTR